MSNAILARLIAISTIERKHDVKGFAELKQLVDSTVEIQVSYHRAKAKK